MKTISKRKNFFCSLKNQIQNFEPVEHPITITPNSCYWNSYCSSPWQKNLNWNENWRSAGGKTTRFSKAFQMFKIWFLICWFRLCLFAADRGLIWPPKFCSDVKLLLNNGSRLSPNFFPGHQLFGEKKRMCKLKTKQIFLAEPTYPNYFFSFLVFNQTSP